MGQACVSITIVTWNSRRYIVPCLESALGQTYRPLEILVADNGSTDGTREALERFDGRVRRILNRDNTGFAVAQNQAIAATCGEWVLTLNPDVVLEEDFVERLVEAGRRHSRAGSVCGKLLALRPDMTPFPDLRIDSAGIYFTPELRHFDRGSRQRDAGQYEQTEYVFGASAAAALYRREMIEDISQGGEFFDPDFFSYREDADVAWRAQLLGWGCLYIPQAVGHHVRRVLPGARHDVPAVLNMHAVKNRFLMRIKNMTPALYRRLWLRATARDLLVLGGCLLKEQSSLPAFWRLAKAMPRARAERRRIMARRRANDEDLAAWFSPHPVSRPLADPLPVAASSLALPG